MKEEIDSICRYNDSPLSFESGFLLVSRRHKKGKPKHLTVKAICAKNYYSQADFCHFHARTHIICSATWDMSVNMQHTISSIEYAFCQRDVISLAVWRTYSAHTVHITNTVARTISCAIHALIAYYSEFSLNLRAGARARVYYTHVSQAGSHRWRTVNINDKIRINTNCILSPILKHISNGRSSRSLLEENCWLNLNWIKRDVGYWMEKHTNAPSLARVQMREMVKESHLRCKRTKFRFANLFTSFSVMNYIHTYLLRIISRISIWSSCSWRAFYLCAATVPTFICVVVGKVASAINVFEKKTWKFPFLACGSARRETGVRVGTFSFHAHGTKTKRDWKYFIRLYLCSISANGFYFSLRKCRLLFTWRICSISYSCMARALRIGIRRRCLGQGMRMHELKVISHGRETKMVWRSMLSQRWRRRSRIRRQKKLFANFSLPP